MDPKREEVKAAHLRSEGEEKFTPREERLLAALWNIRMAAERAQADEPVWVLPNVIIHLALGALGPDKRAAQELAAHV